MSGKMTESIQQNVFGKLFKILLLNIIAASFSLCAFAQYYPGPVPVPLAMEHALKVKLSGKISDADKIGVLLNLSNLFYNKSFKTSTDLNDGINYANQASQLSIRVHDPSGYNNAQLLVADILIAQDKMQDAEKILPLVNDTMKVNLLLTLSFKYANRPTGQNAMNQDSAMYYVQKAKTLATQLHQKRNIITCLKYMGSIHAGQGNLALGEKELLEAVDQYKAIGYPNLQYTYLELVQVNLIKGDYDQALVNSMQTLHYMKLSRDSAYAGDFYFYLAVILSHDSQHQKSLDYAWMALEHVKIHAGYVAIPTAIYEIVVQLISLHQYNQALSFILKGYKNYPPGNDIEKALYLGTIGDCYLKLQQFNEAEKYFLQEFDLRKTSNSLSENTYHRMAFFYIESKQYERARPYLMSALKYMEKDVSMAKKNHLHYMLYLVDSAAGNYVSAIRNLSLTKKYDDTMYKANKVAEIQKLMIQYDAQNKNDQIKLLRQKEMLQDTNIKQANKVRDLTIGGLLIFIIAAFIFYRQNLQKQRNSLLIAQKNAQLEKLLTEKEWLLKEVHHRVKNNLYTVICLLEIQAEFLEDDALKAIENCQHRIYAMSLIHQKLYLSEDVKTVNIADYISELVKYLKESFETQQSISYTLDIAPLHLDVSQAMPLGLIINEAVSNSIKYAFPEKRIGIISIKVEVNDHDVIVKLSDNGIGFSKKTELEKLNSLGLKLMRGLSDDINATICFENKNGTHITIIFTPATLSEKTVTGGITIESEANIEG
jgi:two-component sensor histidine kinase